MKFIPRALTISDTLSNPLFDVNFYRKPFMPPINAPSRSGRKSKIGAIIELKATSLFFH
jgi:hypothetical protein